jgi:predicted nucleic acid-binding Zn ribbon protein
MFLNFKSSLNLRINQLGLNKEVEAVRICQLWDEIIKNKFDKRASEKSKAIKFKNKNLTVAVLSSIWAQEFQYNQQNIIEEINKRIGREAVERINFEL